MELKSRTLSKGHGAVLSHRSDTNVWFGLILGINFEGEIPASSTTHKNITSFIGPGF